MSEKECSLPSGCAPLLCKDFKICSLGLYGDVLYDLTEHCKAFWPCKDSHWQATVQEPTKCSWAAGVQNLCCYTAFSRARLRTWLMDIRAGDIARKMV